MCWGQAEMRSGTGHRPCGVARWAQALLICQAVYAVDPFYTFLDTGSRTCGMAIWAQALLSAQILMLLLKPPPHTHTLQPNLYAGHRACGACQICSCC